MFLTAKQKRCRAGFVTPCIIFNWILMNPRVWDDVLGCGARCCIQTLRLIRLIRRFCEDIVGSGSMLTLIQSIRSACIFKNPTSQMLQLCKTTSHVCLRASSDGHLSLHNKRFIEGWLGRPGGWSSVRESHITERQRQNNPKAGGGGEKLLMEVFPLSFR